GHMREVEQIVDYQKIIGAYFETHLAVGPARITEPRKADRGAFVRQGWIAHPDRDELIALDNGIRAYTDSRRHALLSGNLDALAGAVIHETVITALDRIADHHPHRQWQASMGASVLQRDHFPARIPVENNAMAEKRPRSRLLAHLVGPGADKPVISQERAGPAGADHCLRHAV